MRTRRQPKDDAPARRSRYEERLQEPEEHWERIGELDPHTGFGFVDYSRAGGWVPLAEFLWRRGR